MHWSDLRSPYSAQLWKLEKKKECRCSILAFCFYKRVIINSQNITLENLTELAYPREQNGLNVFWIWLMWYLRGVRRPAARINQDFLFPMKWSAKSNSVRAIFPVWHMFNTFSRDILFSERGGLKIFMRPKREKQTTGQHKTYFPHFLWAITQIKPGKLKAFFLWNASINAVKKEQRDWGGMPHCCYFSCRPWPSYVWECLAVTKAHSLHAPRGGKRIPVVHWRPLRSLVPLYNLC